MSHPTPDEYIRDYERRNFINDMKKEDEFVMKEIRKDPNAFLPFDESVDEFDVVSYSKKDHTSSRDSYYTAMEEQRFASEFVGNWALPGHVSNGKDSCGDFIPKGCLDIDNHKTKSSYSGFFCSSCGSIGCNKCLKQSIRKQAYKTSIRLTGVALNLGSNGFDDDGYTNYNNISHIAFSPPEELWVKLRDDKVFFKKYEKLIHSSLKELGMKAGSIVFHSYRFTKGLKHLKMSKLVPDNAFSPHWHVLAVGYLNGKQVKRMEKGDFKKSDTGNGYDYDYRKYKGMNIISLSLLKTRREVYNVVAYQLSHAGIEVKSGDKRSSKQIVRYFGKANPRHFKLSSVLSSSQSGYDQIDKIFAGREKKTVEGNDYFLSKVGLSMIEFDFDFSKSTSLDRKWFNNKRDLEEFLKSNVSPRYDLKDDPDYDSLCSFTSSVNPAKTKCVTPDKFMCIRLIYSNSKDISYKVSDMVTIFFDPSIGQLCPECSCKIRHLILNVNNIEYQDNFCAETLPMMVKEPGKLFPSDTSMGFEYLTHLNMSHLGLQYFTETEMLYSNGRDTRPECFDKLNDVLKNNIDRKIRYQESARERKEQKRQEWIKNNIDSKNHIVPDKDVIVTDKFSKTQSQKLTSF